MKHFAKSLVSLVIALTILATMCVVGFSASAGTHVIGTNEFVVISETVEKKFEDVKVIKDNNDHKYADDKLADHVQVVDSSTLGTAPGVPSQAYLYKITAGNTNNGDKGAIFIPVNGGSTDASALKGGDMGNTGDVYLDAWIWVENVQNAGVPVLRFTGSYMTDPSSLSVQSAWFKQANLKDASQGFALTGGWYHIQRKVNWGNSVNSTPLNAYYRDYEITGITLHTHSGASADWKIAVASMKLVYKETVDCTDEAAAHGEFIVVSDSKEKNASDLISVTDNSNAKFTNFDNVVSVVNSASLSGAAPEGLPEKAYKISIPANERGAVFVPVNGGTVDASVLQGKTTEVYIDAWIWVSTTISTANTPILRFLGDDYTTDANQSTQLDWIAQGNIYTDIMGKTTGSWVHIQRKVNWGNCWTGGGTEEYQDNKIIQGFTIHAHSGANADGWEIAIASMTLSYSADCVLDDGRDYLVGALSPNESGIDVGSWQPADYDGELGAFTTSTVVKFRKYLTKSYDLTGKLVVAWIYSPVASGVNGQLEICTTANENGEFTFSTNQLGLKAGWNKLILDVNHKNGEGNPAGTIGYVNMQVDAGKEADASDINFVRLYDGDASLAVKMGAMYVVDYGAVSNGTFYDNAEEAFDNAKADDTVTLYGDAAVESVMLNKGIDLELNGNTLTADYFVSFKGSEVADSSADKAGRLAVASENLVLNAENAQLPVFAEDGKGYAFFSVNMQQVTPVADENSVTLTFKPSIGTALNAAWFGDGAADNGLKLGVRLTYKSQYAYDGGTATGTVSDTFVFDDAHVASIYTKGTAMKITITGIADVSDLTIASVVVSDLGFECVGDVVSVQ